MFYLKKRRIQIGIIIFLSVLFSVLAVIGFSSISENPVSSVEVGFASLSPAGYSGGFVIPASCPSYEHFPGECEPPPPPLPTCSASFSPNPVNYSQTSDVTWSQSGDDDNSIPYTCSGNLLSGTLTGAGGTFTTAPITESQNCTLTVQNSTGTNFCEAAVTMTAAPACSASFSPNPISAGQTSNVTWSQSGDADNSMPYTCSGNLLSGTLTGAGGTFTTGAITGSQTCTMTVVDSAGTKGTCQASVTAVPAPTCSASFSPNPVSSGQTSNVTWSQSGDADNMIPYSCDGNFGSGPNLPASPFTTGAITESQTCTMTVQNSIGTTVTCQASITVSGGPVCSPSSSNISIGQSVNFSASGGSGGYTWSAPTASPASGSGSSFNPSFPTTGSGQTVTVRDSASAQNSCTVNVSSGPVVPTGDIKADGSDRPISKTAGQSAIVSWTSSDATTCRATPGSFTQGISNSGQSTGVLSSDVTYTLYCSNANYTDVPVDTVTINVSGAGLRPDYLVSSMSAPATIRGGQTMTVNATIANNGQIAYGGSTTAALCIWNTNQVNGAISVYGSIQDQIYAGGGCGSVDTKIIPPLNNAPTVPYLQSVTFNWIAWSFPPSYFLNPGTNPYYAIVVADDGNLVFPELDDIINNVQFQTFTLLPPLLEAGLTAVPNSGPEILNVSLNATAWGAAVGATADYFFWWTCANATTDVATAEGACGTLPSGASEIIVDNSGGDTFSGNWSVGSGLNGVPYGTDSLMSNESSANYRITPNVPFAGTYDVYIWYQGFTCGALCPIGFPPTYPVIVFDGITSNTTNVPLRGGFFLFPIPPPSNGWYKLGNFSLPAGNSAYVQFGTGYDGSTFSYRGIADAVRLVPAVGACTTNSSGAKCLGVPTNTDPETGEVSGSENMLHDYNASGSPYTPKVIITSNGLSDEARTTVTVIGPPPGNFNLSLGGGLACNSVPISWTASAGAIAYRILKGAARVDITPYNPYTALNFTDTSVVQNTDYKYQIEAYNGGGTNRSNSLNVTTPYCPPTLNFSGDPTNIYEGQSSRLTWSSTYTTSCIASGAWSGSKSLSGEEIVIPLPPPSVTYTLTCTGLGGSTGPQSVIINVSPLGLPGWREIIPR